VASKRNWDRRFADPIPLRDGRMLLTLRDAGAYVAALSPAEQQLTHWQTAAELLLLLATKGGDPMLPRIAMMQALNFGQPDPKLSPRVKGAKVYTIIRSKTKTTSSEQ
jgi:hypothetical protein